MALKITDKCKGCGACAENCAFEAIVKKGDKYEITENCAECESCMDACPAGAIEKK